MAVVRGLGGGGCALHAQLADGLQHRPVPVPRGGLRRLLARSERALCSRRGRVLGGYRRCAARDRIHLTPSAGAASLIEHMFAEGDPVLTDRQRQILDFLTKYVDAHGYPPTVREIGEAVGLASPSPVHAHLANLERAGLLRRDPTKPRAIELVGRERREAPAATLERLPLVGQI